MSSNIPMAPQGNMPAIGIPDSQDIPRLVFSAPYFEQVPLAELIAPTVTEAVEAQLPALVPPYVQGAAETAVSQLAVLLTGSTMSGPLFLSPLMPTQPSQAATMAYVDSMVATAGIPEVPPVPSGQVWARETGQWVPITPQTGVFLPLTGGTMTGNISMSGNTIQNMAAVPAMPNGAAPAQWVLNQIASVSLYQGTWNADTNTPDLTQLSTHVNAYTWIAITTAVGGVVIGAAIPGLQGMTIFNGDTIIYSTVQGQFMAIHAGGLTLPEADERYVQLGGSQMSGALLLNANASQPLQAVTLQQMQTFVPPGVVPEAPNDGQLYGRNGLTASWAPVLPLAGGILTGALTLAGNATANLNPVPLQQMTSAISAATAGFLPLAGGTMSGLMTLSGNASVSLNPVPLQQLNAMLAGYATTNFVNATFLPLTGGTLTGALVGTSANFGSTLNVTGAVGLSSTLNLVGPTITLAGNTITGGTNTVTFNSGTVTFNNNVNVEGLSHLGSGGALALNAAVEISPPASENGAAAFCGAVGGAAYVARTDATNIFFHTFISGPSTAVGTISNNGGSTGFNTTSDGRLKTNVETLSEAGAIIDRLRPVTFNWLSDDEGRAPSHGFIAQEAMEVFPDAIAGGIGEPGEEGFRPYGMDSGKFMPLVIAELQVLRGRVAALEAKA